MRGFSGQMIFLSSLCRRNNRQRKFGALRGSHGGRGKTHFKTEDFIEEPETTRKISRY